MEVLGLATDPAAESYLREAYGVVRKDWVAGIPIFQDRHGEWFVGGYKHIYSVLIGDTMDAFRQLDLWRAGKRIVRYTFSEQQNLFKSQRFDHVLELPSTTNAANRLELYARNVRKHIRNSVEPSGIRYSCENGQAQWYEAYLQAMARHRHIPHPPEWFDTLERHFKENIVIVCARSGERIVGMLYCIRSDNYIQLLSIASDPAYRSSRVDSGLYDSAVVFAIKHDIHYVDFGPTMQWDKSHWEVKENFGAGQMYFADASFMSTLDRTWHFTRDIISRANARVRKIRQ